MARAFSGTSQYLSRTNPTGISVNAAWTFIANIWINNLVENRTFLLMGTPGATLTGGVWIGQEDTDRFMIRINGDNLSPVAGLMTAGAWHRMSISHSGAGDATFTVAVDGTQLWSQVGGFTIPGLISGDVVRFGSDASFLYYNDHAGKFAWSAWIQGTAISVANADTYAQNPCNLITDYGTSGAITANALKGLWPFQSGNPGQDISGVGNDLTDTSTTDTADPGGYPTSCGGGGGGGGIPARVPVRIDQLGINPTRISTIDQNIFSYL